MRIKCNSVWCVGDIHGSYLELCQLLAKLGFGRDLISGKWVSRTGEIVVFTGDLIDRGEYPVEVLELVMDMVEEGIGYLVRSNHDDKLRRYLRDDLAGEPIRVKVKEEFSETLRLIKDSFLDFELDVFKEKLYKFLDNLPHHLEVETSEGIAIIAHAAYVPAKKDKVFKELCLTGENKGEKDKDGHTIRTYDWLDEYNGPAEWIVIGHDMVKSPKRAFGKNGVKLWKIDTGCYKTGILSAISLPSEEIVQSI